MKTVLCFDIGGTTIKCGLYREDGTLVKKIPSRPTDPVTTPIIETVRKMVYEVKAYTSFSGIAISSAGVIDSQKGAVVYSGYTIPNYTGTNFKSTFEEEFSVPCEVENDVNAACLAEFWKGAGRGAESLVCLTIGTGVGGAVMIDGKLINGVGFTAGEIGYMAIDGNYFQDIASTTFLIQKANELAGCQKFENGKEIFAGAIQKDLICQEAITQLIDNLAQGLVNIIYLLNPEKIVLGGGIMGQKDYLNGKIKEAVSVKLISPMFDKTEIDFAENGNDAGMLGALYHFVQKHK